MGTFEKVTDSVIYVDQINVNYVKNNHRILKLYMF